MSSDMNGAPVSLLYGTASVVNHRSVIPKEKKDKELFVVKEFSNIRTVNNLPLLGIENCEDSDKKPDVICKHGNGTLRIQVTELKSPSQTGATSLSLFFIAKILREIERRARSQEEKILVNIVPRIQKSNKAIKLKDSEIKILVDLILDGVERKRFSHSVAHLLTTSSKESLTCLDLPSALLKKIKMLWLELIPGGAKCYCAGTNNIYLGVDFCSRHTNYDLLRSLIDDIYRKKNCGFSDMLLIWSGDVSLYGDREKIVPILRERFAKSSFKHVYFFSFAEVGTVFQQNRNAYQIV